MESCPAHPGPSGRSGSPYGEGSRRHASGDNRALQGRRCADQLSSDAQASTQHGGGSSNVCVGPGTSGSQSFSNVDHSRILDRQCGPPASVDASSRATRTISPGPGHSTGASPDVTQLKIRTFKPFRIVQMTAMPTQLC